MNVISGYLQWFIVMLCTLTLHYIKHHITILANIFSDTVERTIVIIYFCKLVWSVTLFAITDANINNSYYATTTLVYSKNYTIELCLKIIAKMY